MSDPLLRPQLIKLLIISDNQSEGSKLTKFLNDNEKGVSAILINANSYVSEIENLKERFEIVIVLKTNSLEWDVYDTLRAIKKKFLSAEIIAIGCENISESDITGINIFDEFTYPYEFGAVIMAI